MQVDEPHFISFCIFTRSANNWVNTNGVNLKSAKLLALFWTNAIGQIDDIYNTWFYCRSFYTPLGRAGTTAENE